MKTPQPEITETVALWEDWWNRRNRGALPYIIYPQGTHADLGTFEKDWMPESVLDEWDHWKPELMGAKAFELSLAQGDTRFIDEWLDYMDAYADHYGHVAAGYNFICPGFGPACLAAFISGFFRYAEPTVWFEPPVPMEFEEIDEAIKNPSDQVLAYRELAFDILERMAARLGGRYVISMPDFGEGMDILSALRHNMELLTDLYDSPEEILASLGRIGFLAEEIFERAWRILAPANGGACASVMRYLSETPHYMTYCDFSAMIGPAHFEEFVLPMVKRHCSKFPGRTIYHLDGPGQLPHVPLLCTVDDLFAIQWVQGAGNPGPFDPGWDDLYRQILDAGKRISIGSPPDADFRTFFGKFPATEFTLNIIAGDEESGRGAAEALRHYGTTKTNN